MALVMTITLFQEIIRIMSPHLSSSRGHLMQTYQHLDCNIPYEKLSITPTWGGASKVLWLAKGTTHAKWGLNSQPSAYETCSVPLENMYITTLDTAV